MKLLNTLCSIAPLLAGILRMSYGQANQTCIHTGLITPVHNFTMDRILGTWYQHKFYAGLKDDVKPRTVRCLEANINKTSNDFVPIIAYESFIDFSSGTDVSKQASDFMFVSEVNPAIFKVVTVFEENPLLETDWVFVQTDYENWTIEYGCNVENNYRYETMQIRTRTRNPDPELMALLEIFVQNYGFPPENGVTIDQTNC